ncbi:MAG: hypothetical protein JSS32_08195 [Verrucomicrobia bacterium]|nr:hypothetical protein [Verrucomicrobiota bacterium]
MITTKNDISEASRKIGLTDSQAENLWQALQEIHTAKPKSNLLAAFLYFGALIAFLSMTWFYIANLGNSYTLLISSTYAIIFFGTGSYLWRINKLRVPGGVLHSLGIIMVPLIVYSLQHVMLWWPSPSLNDYSGFYRWISGDWVMMEICTLAVACFVLYFVRFPFITSLIYFVISFISMDAINLFSDPMKYNWFYYCIAALSIGILLNILAFVLSRKDQKDFSFWSYLFGTFMFWSGLTGLDIQTERGYFIYFLINLAFVLLSNFFHRKIFMFFGSLGIVCYVSHLAYIFSDSVFFSYALGAMGFVIIMLAAFLMRPRKVTQMN